MCHFPTRLPPFNLQGSIIRLLPQAQDSGSSGPASARDVATRGRTSTQAPRGTERRRRGRRREEEGKEEERKKKKKKTKKREGAGEKGREESRGARGPRTEQKEDRGTRQEERTEKETQTTDRDNRQGQGQEGGGRRGEKERREREETRPTKDRRGGRQAGQEREDVKWISRCIYMCNCYSNATNGCKHANTSIPEDDNYRKSSQ